VTEGNLVSSGQTLLTTLVSLDPIYVRFDGDEQAYLKYTKIARENAAHQAQANAARQGEAQKAHGHGNKSQDSGTPAASAGEAGAEVMVGLANEPGYPHKGVMVFVDNELDPTTGTIRGRAKLDNHDRAFTPGLFARVKLMGSNQYDALLINDSAIGTDQTVRYVLVVGADNKVQYRPVKLGPIIDGLRVVTDGLHPGETIVVNGLQRVRPGSPVTPERVAMGERRRGLGNQPETMLAGNTDVGGTAATAKDTGANTGTTTAVTGNANDTGTAAAKTGTAAAANSTAANSGTAAAANSTAVNTGTAAAANSTAANTSTAAAAAGIAANSGTATATPGSVPANATKAGATAKATVTPNPPRASRHHAPAKLALNSSDDTTRPTADAVSSN
jgi:hypothetical protein